MLMLALAAACNRQPPVQAKQDSGPVAVSVARVVTRDIQRSVDSIGTLFPYDEVLISAEIDGRVDEVKADLGDNVAERQVLVHISDEEQKFVVAQNEAQLHQSLERLGLAGEDDKVKDIRETPEVRRARADLTEAEQRHRVLKSLVAQGIGAKSDLDQATARMQAMQAAYDAVQNQTRNLVAEVERYKAMLGLQRKKLRDTTVRAPFRASVKDRQVTVGQYVRANTPLMTLVKIDPIRLRIEIPERMAPWVKNDMTVEVTLEAFTDRKFSGKIWRISPTVDQSKRTFMVEALIQNRDGALKPGSYARARVPTNKVEHIKLIPVSAVNYVLGSNKAYVVKDEVVETRELKLGDRFNKDVEILEGIDAGDVVATSNLMRIDTGSKVRSSGLEVAKGE